MPYLKAPYFLQTLLLYKILNNMTNTEKQELFKNFHLQVGDRVCHIKEPSATGTITGIDFDSYPFYMHEITTCLVQWDDAVSNELDIQWTNKLEKLD